MVCVLAACHSMVCVLAACHRYGVCTGSMSYLRCVYWQRVMVMVCLLAACHRYGVCTVRCVKYNDDYHLINRQNINR